MWLFLRWSDVYFELIWYDNEGEFGQGEYRYRALCAINQSYIYIFQANGIDNTRVNLLLM